MTDHRDHAACCNIENLAQRENSIYQVPNGLFSLFSWFVVTPRLWLTFDSGHTRKMQKISNVLNRAEGLWLMRVCDWLVEKRRAFRVLLYQDSPGTDPSSSSWIHSMKEKCNSRFSLDPLSMSPELSMTIDYGPPGVMQWSLHKRRVRPIRCHGLCTQLGSNLLLPHEPWVDKTV